MKEDFFIEIIKETLPESSRFIGDDTAYIPEKDLILTQDTLIEDVHFRKSTISPYYLGRKSIAVNLSDIAASGGVPTYVLISLSMPENIEESFIKEFYKGVHEICKEYGVLVVGGDLTKSFQITVSVCAVGFGNGLIPASRKNAKAGDYVVVTGNFGSSRAGLEILENYINVNLKSSCSEYSDCHSEDFSPKNLLNGENSQMDRFFASLRMTEKIHDNNMAAIKKFIEAHINPVPRIKEGRIILETAKKPALMDSSDGLADALSKICLFSNVGMEINFDDIPYDKDLSLVLSKLNRWGERGDFVAEVNPNNKIAPLEGGMGGDSKNNILNDKLFKWVLFGGEDYELVGTVSEKVYKKLLEINLPIIKIGTVIPPDSSPCPSIKFKNKTIKIDSEMMKKEIFGHFADCEQRLEGGGDEPSTEMPFNASNQATEEENK